MQRLLAAALAVLALTGCAVSEQYQQQRRQQMARRIVDDAMAFNEAYHQAITSQVLLNILRAANRQPRQYMSMSGFTQNGGARSASISVGGVALDQIGESWGEGDWSASRSRPDADYTISPFATDAFANIVLRPTNPSLFRYYWDSGWNPDLLLMLLVDRLRIVPVRGGAPRDFRNSAGTIVEDCAGEHDEAGCAFVLAMRQFALDLSRAERVAAPAAAEDRCGPFAVYVTSDAGAAAQARRAGRLTHARGDAPCPIEIVVGDQRYVLGLRSLDDTVYYVGQLMRRDPNAAAPAPPGEMRARLGVTSPGFPIWANERTPLFRIVEATRESERDYSATVSFGGRRYSAGAPVDRFCYDEANIDACRTGEYLDISGAVLELLVGILAFNQSEDVVAPPQSSLLQVR